MAAPTPGSWAFAEELFERGDPGFVDELRRVTDADRLGEFAARWPTDPRPVARQFLFDWATNLVDRTIPSQGRQT